MAADAKTRATEEDVSGYIERIESPALRADAVELVGLFARLTREPARMWGPSIIGFGSYDYTYDSGHSGTSLRIGFAARKSGLVIYIVPGFDEFSAELAAIGPHTNSKSCLNIKNLQKTNMAALENLAKKALAIMDARYPRA